MNETRMPTVEECIQESWGLADELRPILLGLPDKDGTLWQPFGGLPFSPAYLKFFQTAWFYKIARYQSDYLYRVNGYAQSAIDNLVTMTMGSGFQYQCENVSMQTRLDEWLHKTKFKRRSREAFIRLLVQGEVFYRKFDDEIRFVDPDLVYDGKYIGVEQDEEDYEIVKAYWINGQRIDSEEVQHRKLALSGEKRGVSILFSIASHLMAAEQLLHNLNRTADMQSRFAGIRTHKAAMDSVMEFRGQVRTEVPTGNDPNFPRNPKENYEHYPPGSIIDLGDGTVWNAPGAALDAEKYVSVLRAVLRLCAARVGLPENILSQDQDSMGAYNSSLVADGHSTKAMEVWQEKLGEWDLELFELFGFDASKIKVVCPEIALHDKNQTVLEGGFLLDKKLATKQTVAKMFNIDYAAELEQDPSLDEEPEPVSNGQERDPQDPNQAPKENDPAPLDKGQEEANAAI